jgi:hypothetical protein
VAILPLLPQGLWLGPRFGPVSACESCSWVPAGCCRARACWSEWVSETRRRHAAGSASDTEANREDQRASCRSYRAVWVRRNG